jgi:hypothetical protein
MENIENNRILLTIPIHLRDDDKKMILTKYFISLRNIQKIEFRGLLQFTNNSIQPILFQIIHNDYSKILIAILKRFQFINEYILNKNNYNDIFHIPILFISNHNIISFQFDYKTFIQYYNPKSDTINKLFETIINYIESINSFKDLKKINLIRGVIVEIISWNKIKKLNEIPINLLLPNL